MNYEYRSQTAKTPARDQAQNGPQSVLERDLIPICTGLAHFLNKSLSPSSLS